MLFLIQCALAFRPLPAVSTLLQASLPAPPSCQLTFVRHAETQANATGKYNERTLNTLSKKGNQEVEDLTRKLEAEPNFDQIYVSPAPRAMRTIAPYLRAKHLTAMIWPLLYECCTGRRPKNPHAVPFRYGSEIKIPMDLNGLFRTLPQEDRYPDAPRYEQGLSQVDAAVKEFRNRLGHGRILLVGHSGQGGHFIHALTGKWTRVENAREIALTVR